MMLRGYRNLRPSKTRPKKPFNYHMMAKAMTYCDFNTYNGSLNAAALCVGYYFGGRVGEYTAYSTGDWSKIVRFCDLTFIGHQPLKSLIIDFRKHKANQHGLYCAKVEALCCCKQGMCPVHIIWQYLQFRNKIWSNANNSPLLLQLNNGYPLNSNHVNNLVKNMVTKLKLNPYDYSSHSLRSGRATDLSRCNVKDEHIQKWGRWRSDCWKEHYAKLDHSDIAEITSLTLSDLGVVRNVSF